MLWEGRQIRQEEIKLSEIRQAQKDKYWIQYHIESGAATFVARPVRGDHQEFQSRCREKGEPQ